MPIFRVLLFSVSSGGACQRHKTPSLFLRYRGIMKSYLENLEVSAVKSTLCHMLNFKLKPVAIFFTDRKPKETFQAQPGQRVCAASMLVAAAKNDVVSTFDEETYGCPGGGVGLCFGNTFQKKNHPTEALLSNGDEVLQQQGRTFSRSLGRGERFFATPELVRKWADAVPYAETPQKYVVFKPLHMVTEEETPDLVFLFSNPDQLSALVILCGYYRGEALNVLAPFASACQSILLAYQEMEKDSPKAIMGYFDISQRGNIPKEILSLTMPYKMFLELERSAAEGCLTTDAWGRIKDRYGEETL